MGILINVVLNLFSELIFLLLIVDALNQVDKLLYIITMRLKGDLYRILEQSWGEQYSEYLDVQEKSSEGAESPGFSCKHEVIRYEPITTTILVLSVDSDFGTASSTADSWGEVATVL